MDMLKLNKKVMRIKFKITGLLMFIVFFCHAQNFQEDMKLIQNRMSGLKQFHAKTSIDIYNGVGKANDSRTSEIKLQGQKVRVKTEGIEALYTPKHIVTVIEKNKLISYGKGNGKLSEKAMKSLIPDLDSLVHQFDSIRFVRLSNNSKRYKLYTSKGMFSEVILDLSSDLKYKRIEYKYNPSEYNSQTKVIIHFKVWNENATISSKTFDISNFLIGVSSDYQPAEKYTGYQVLLTEEINK